MSFTPNNQFESGTEGQADWDTLVNGNVQVADRGFHAKLTAGLAISSGQACVVNSAGYLVPMDGRSYDLTPQALSYRSVNSGEEAVFITDGAVNSMAVWSAFLIPGQPVYVAAASLGFLVSSYAGHGRPAGWALNKTSVRFQPTLRVLPELTTEVMSVGPVLVGSYGDFAMTLANRGINRKLEVSAQSANLYKIQFWSGSARVNSELLYETLTHSTALGSGDVNSVYVLDQAMFPWFNTDTGSPALVFGRITVQSGCQVNSSNFSVTAQVERFR